MNFASRVSTPGRWRRGEHERPENPGAGILQGPLARRERGPRREHVVHQEARRARSWGVPARPTAGETDAPEARATAPRPQAHLVPSSPSPLRQDGRRDRVDPGLHEATREGPGEPLDGLGAPCATGRGGRGCGHDQDARSSTGPSRRRWPEGITHPGGDGAPSTVHGPTEEGREVVTPLVLPRDHDAPERACVRRERPHRERRGPVHPVQARGVGLPTCRGSFQEPGARGAEHDVLGAAAGALDRDEQARERPPPAAHGRQGRSETVDAVVRVRGHGPILPVGASPCRPPRCDLWTPAPGAGLCTGRPVAPGPVAPGPVPPGPVPTSGRCPLSPGTWAARRPRSASPRPHPTGCDRTGSRPG